MSENLSFRVHGVEIRFKSVERGLFEFVRHNFSHFLLPTVLDVEPDIDVYVDGYWAYGRRPRFAPSNGEMTRRLGTGLYWYGQKLYWLTPRIRTETFFRRGRLFVRGDYTERQDYTIRRVLLRNRSISYQNYQTLMRYVMHYPLFWWLVRAQGVGVLHASAVVKDGLSLVFTGLNGSGKSSMASQLWMNEGFKLLSDNYLLFDDSRLYGFPEVVRTETNLAGRTCIVHTMPVPIFKKYQAVLSSDLVSLTAPLGSLFFTSIGRKTTITPISSSDMMQWLDRIFCFLGEFVENTYMAFFNPSYLPTAWSTDWQGRLRQNLEMFVRVSQCYELKIGQGEPAEETAKQLLKVVS